MKPPKLMPGDRVRPAHNVDAVYVVESIDVQRTVYTDASGHRRRKTLCFVHARTDSGLPACFPLQSLGIHWMKILK